MKTKRKTDADHLRDAQEIIRQKNATIAALTRELRKLHTGRVKITYENDED